MTRLLLRDEKEKALWDKKFGPPQPTEERGRERSETDSDRDDNKRQEIAPDSSNNSISSEEMALEPAAVQGPSNMLTDRTTIQPSVALQHDSAAQITADRTTDKSSPLRSSTDSPQQLWKQLTTVRATIAQLQVYEASLVAQLPASQQVETASPPASAPTPPVHAMHVPMAAMLGAAVPLVQQPELHEPPQPSADTGHAASAPPLPSSPPAPLARPSSLVGRRAPPGGARHMRRLPQRVRRRRRLQRLRCSRPRRRGGGHLPTAAATRWPHRPALRRPSTSGATSCSRRPSAHSRIRRPPSRIS